MVVVNNSLPGVDEALVIVGSDRRGTVYGTYELSEQIGVSPWYDWADVSVKKQQNLSIKPGKYTAEEPAVKYRDIFLNDEASCLTTWVHNTYGTNYGDHRFYERVLSCCFIYAPTICGLPCGARASILMTSRIVRRLTKWKLLWGLLIMSQWRETIRNRQETERNMENGITEAIRKILISFLRYTKSCQNRRSDHHRYVR